MGAATTPQPFWTSKTFWALTLAFVFNLAHMAGYIPANTDTTGLVNLVLAFLTGIFRWTADQPLTVSPDATKT